MYKFKKDGGGGGGSASSTTTVSTFSFRKGRGVLEGYYKFLTY